MRGEESWGVIRGEESGRDKKERDNKGSGEWEGS